MAGYIERFISMFSFVVWYVVDRNADSIKSFLDTVSWLHDFRLERVEYIPSKNMIDLEYEFDTHEFSIVLRFKDVYDFHFDPNDNYPANWIFEASLFVMEAENSYVGERFFFSDVDCITPERANAAEDNRSRINRVIADRMFWAYKNKSGEITEIPADMKFGVYYNYDETEMYDYNPKEFLGSLDINND